MVEGDALVWERWGNLETCTIIATEANDLMQILHTRMPTILPPRLTDLGS